MFPEGGELRSDPERGAAQHNEGDGGIQVRPGGDDLGGHDPGGGRETHQGCGELCFDATYVTVCQLILY